MSDCGTSFSEVSHEESEPPQEDKPPSKVPLIQKTLQLRQRGIRPAGRLGVIECQYELQHLVGYLNRQRISGMPFV